MRAVFSVFLLAGCRVALEEPQSTEFTCQELTVQVCEDAALHSDFGFIHDKILSKNCSGTSCHQTNSTDKNAAMLRFDDRLLAYDDLVGGNGLGVKSRINLDLNIIEPGKPTESYMLFLMHAVSKEEFAIPIGDPPEDVGYMPRSNSPLCCQKLEAVRRWVDNGAARD